MAIHDFVHLQRLRSWLPSKKMAFRLSKFFADGESSPSLAPRYLAGSWTKKKKNEVYVARKRLLSDLSERGRTYDDVEIYRECRGIERPPLN